MPTEWLTEPIQSFFETEGEEEGEPGDHQSVNALANMGNMLMILLLALIVTTLVVLLVKCGHKCSQTCKTKASQMKKKLLWNFFLRFSLQSFLKISIGALFAVSVVDFTSSASSSVNAAINILTVVLISSLPVFYAILMHRNKGSLNQEGMKEKIGSLYLEMRVDTVSQRLFASLFLARRLLYAAITVAFYEKPGCLITLFMLMNTLNMIYLGYCRPHLTKLAEFMDYYNEVCLQLICYQIAVIPATLKTSDEDVIGWIIIALVMFVFLSNLAVMLAQVLIQTKRKLFLRKLKAT